MKIIELRIGNLIRFNNLIEPEKIVNVEGWFFRPFKENEGVSCYYQPIPITEEWLLKFGWTYHKSEECIYYSHSWGTNGVEIIVKDYHYKGFEIELGKARFKSIESVHQLQNLYYALTGEELTIKQ